MRTLRTSKPIIGGDVDVEIGLFPLNHQHTCAQQTISDATDEECQQPLGGA